MENIVKKRYLKDPANYDKTPFIPVSTHTEDCTRGWGKIRAKLGRTLLNEKKQKHVLAIETYHGVHHDELIENLQKAIPDCIFIDTRDVMLPSDQIDQLMEKYLGDHPVFGVISKLNMIDLFDPFRLKESRQQIANTEKGNFVVYGPGATLLAPNRDLLVYADMARWEIQQRMRRNEISNLGVQNQELRTSLQYKRAYFVDWRICDRHKIGLMNSWDFILDTNQPYDPKMITGKSLEKALDMATRQPFRVVPFFDPGVWGGQWMKEVCDLDPDKINYAWCFDCVPEENSLLLGFGDCLVEIPSINLVFRHPKDLLGQEVFSRFGAEFPIRFDFLDTMDGGNLSLQVHPLTEYIQEQFGMDYTQDESYYMLDVAEDACVYLGFKEDVDPRQMLEELEAAQQGESLFDAEKHVEKWPVKKHDHVLIPAGTIHCSGKNSMVLEISATPYIFTFKLWDWGRVDLDGKPRPISIGHGKEVLQWDRTTTWTEKELINRIELITSGDGWREERTGLHESEFIETRRHWFSKKVPHHTNGTVNVINLVEGREAIIESPDGAFEAFVIHYAETVIIPARVGAYTIRPYGDAEGKECATIKAYVRD